MSQEEEERLKQRRERNKQAAAKCRKRRDDVTNVLIAVSQLTRTFYHMIQHFYSEIVRFIFVLFYLSGN